MRATRAKHALLLRVTAILLASAGSIGLASWPPVRHQLEMSFKRQPQPYTELYFTAPPTATEISADQFRSNVAFGITNHEGKTTRYSYVVTFRDDGHLIGRATGTVTAAAEQTATTEATVGGSGDDGAPAWDFAEVQLTGGADLHITYRHATE
jgi:hypothetical protein